MGPDWCAHMCWSVAFCVCVCLCGVSSFVCAHLCVCMCLGVNMCVCEQGGVHAYVCVLSTFQLKWRKTEWAACEVVSSLSFGLLIGTLGSWRLGRSSCKGRGTLQRWWTDSQPQDPRILALCTGIQETWFLVVTLALPSGLSESFAPLGLSSPARGL